MGMRVYVAGPIAGQPDGNRAAFAKRAKELQEAGHDPVNPWDIEPTHDHGRCIGRIVEHSITHRYGCFLRAYIEELMYCDAISLLPGWNLSVGATTEHAVAMALGLEVV